MKSKYIIVQEYEGHVFRYVIKKLVPTWFGLSRDYETITDIYGYKVLFYNLQNAKDFIEQIKAGQVVYETN